MVPFRSKNLNQNANDGDDLSYDESVASESVDMPIVTIDENQKTFTEERETLTSTSSNNLSKGFGRFFAHWKILMAGQVLSILLAFSAAMSASMHFDCNVSAPTMQTALVFALMSFHFLTLAGRKNSTNEEKKLENEESDNIGATNVIGTSESPESFDDNQASEDHRKIGTYSILCKGICIPWWVYALLALVSAEATFLTFLAYKYTSLPSASLLDNTNIIAAMLGSRFILNRRYHATHILGAIICCAGVFFNVFSDFEEAGNDPDLIDDAVEKTMAEVYPKKVLGDIFAILGGLMVGLCDVLIESIVKDHVTLNEYLGTVGLFGAIIGFTQAGLMEKDQIVKFFAPNASTLISSEELYDLYDDPYDGPRTCSQEKSIGLLIAYTLSQYAFNYSMGRFLKESESALLTLSLLTADLYAVIFTIVAEKIPPPTLFYAAFVLVVIGVMVYEMSPSPLGYTNELQDSRGIKQAIGQWQHRDEQDNLQMGRVRLHQRGSRTSDDDNASVVSHEII